MKVLDVMDKEFIKVERTTDLLVLAKLFARKGASGALVVDGQGRIEGIVTETDLIFQEKRLHIPTFVTFLDAVIFLEGTTKFKDEMRKMAAVTVGDIMTSAPVTITAGTEISEAATIMVEKEISHLPVVAGDIAIGLVDKHSLLKAFIADHEKR